MIGLADHGYEVDNVCRGSWARIMLQFSDAYFYQTWSYGAVRWGENNLSHLVLKRDGEIVAAVQVRLIRIPGIGSGVAYVTWGPMWQRRDVTPDTDVLAQMIRSMRLEYVKRRGLFLRVLPHDEDTGDDALKDLITAEGFKWFAKDYKTLMMDLTYSLDELRASLRRTWRQTLNKAMRGNLVVREGVSDELFQECLRIYDQMQSRKGFAQFVDMEEYRRIQVDLPDELKMRIMVCCADDEPAAALIWSKIGTTGVPMLAATGDRALQLNALYFLYWNMIERMKESGCVSLNLGGVSMVDNPGGYGWKTGLSGKLGREVGQIGRFDACDSLSSAAIVKFGDKFRSWRGRRKMKNAKAKKNKDV